MQVEVSTLNFTRYSRQEITSTDSVGIEPASKGVNEYSIRLGEGNCTDANHKFMKVSTLSISEPKVGIFLFDTATLL